MDQWWVLIPLAGIAAGVFREFFRMRIRQQNLGTSTHGLAKEVATLKAENSALLDRIQNLETIVVSQTWDVIHDKGLSPVERDLKISSTTRRELAEPARETANQQAAEQLARRLRA
ncbi:MAG TPA: hypothetical protein VIW92_05260 [Thermoanaerobaculia bacterium]